MRYYDDDFPPQFYNPHMNPRRPRDVDGLSQFEMAKAGVRYYKSIIAEFKRDEDKKSKSKKEEEEKKKSTRWNIFAKLTTGQWALILFFTWWVIPLSQIWAVAFLKQTWESFTHGP